MNQQIRIKNHTLLLALAAAYPLAGHATSAARLEFASGSVVAITAAGVQRELSRGSELQPGDTIRTGDNARAQLRFSDGGMMSLQPKTDFRIDEYKYDGKLDGQERSFFSLIRGGLRTISGLIGHGNRDNYKVTTAVATIGIRGTEYSAVFTGGNDGILNLATGEGAVEICNAGGCAIVSSGESAIVTGNTPPKFTPVRPYLPPASVGTPVSATPYSVAETRNDSGTLALLGADLQSGSDYAISWAFNQSGSYKHHFNNPATYATFEPGSKLVNFVGSDAYTPNEVKGAFSIDGVIGWGSWSDGTYGSGTPFTDLHYVVGKPTSASDLNNLSGMTATYALTGFTTPTSTLGALASNVKSDMQVDFSSGSTSVDVNLSMTLQGQTLSFSASGGGSGADFTASGSGALGSSVDMKGFFAGANAGHAGLTYKIDTATMGLGQVGGAAVYTQKSVAPTVVHP